jgi:hypothetical protein
MSSTCSPALADLVSALNALECEPSRFAKLIPIASECSESTGQMSLFTETSESLPQRALWPTPTVPNGGRTIHHVDQFNGRTAYHKGKKVQVDLNQAVKLASSAAAFPARTSPSPERARALAASAAAYGRNTPELLAKYDLSTSSWRTSQLCLDGALSEFSETWPRSGLMRSGIAYQLPPLVRLTDETEFGLWPTPVANDDNKSPEAHMAMKQRMKGGPRNTITSLNVMVKATERGMWPTPHSNMSTGPWRQGREGGPNLQTAAGGSLNPTWVEWLMGFPPGWTDLGPSETPSSRKSPKSSEGQS